MGCNCTSWRNPKMTIVQDGPLDQYLLKHLFVVLLAARSRQQVFPIRKNFWWKRWDFGRSANTAGCTDLKWEPEMAAPRLIWSNRGTNGVDEWGRGVSITSPGVPRMTPNKPSGGGSCRRWVMACRLSWTVNIFIRS